MFADHVNWERIFNVCVCVDGEGGDTLTTRFTKSIVKQSVN